MPFVKGHKVNLGKHWKMSDEGRRNLSKALKGKKVSSEARLNMSLCQIGHPVSPETREKIAASRRGAKSHFWRGGVTALNMKNRTGADYRNWRKSVFERDNYTCQDCGDQSGNGKRVTLNADHIKPWALYPDDRFNLDNGRTLCLGCHKKTDSFGYKALKNYMQKKYA